MSHKWRIRCTIHGWQYGWADDIITECPIEPTDSLVEGMTFSVGKEIPVITLVPNITMIQNDSFERVASIIYDTTYWGDLSHIEVLSSMDKGITSYDVEIYDRKTHSTIAEINLSNIGDVQPFYLGEIYSPPQGKLILEIYVKKNGGKKNQYVHIENIVVYTKRE